MDAHEILRDNLQALLKRAQASDPVEIRDGERHYVVRAQPHLLPITLAMGMSVDDLVRHTSQPAGAENRAEGDGQVQTRATDEVDTSTMQVKGTASSTSVDWYGTDMSRGCLEDMAEQMKRGVSLFPTHGSWLSRVEWDGEIGITVEASLRSAAVDDPPPGTESDTQYILEMTADLWTGGCAKAADLARRLELKQKMDGEGKRGQKIGLSIGGWFREIRYITDDEGDLIRVIVERVELDHVAVTRNPANPDSDNLQLVRSTWGAVRAANRATDPDPGEARSGDSPPGVTAGERVDPHAGNGETHDDTAQGRTEDFMTEEEKAALLEDVRRTAAESSTAAIREMLPEIREAVTPKPAPQQEPAGRSADDDAVLQAREAARVAEEKLQQAEERARIAEGQRKHAEQQQAATRAALAAQAGIGGRRGTPHPRSFSDDPGQVPHEIRAIIDEAQSGGNAETVCAVVERNIPLLSVDMRDTSPEGFALVRRAKTSARELLGTICRAAENDGIIRDPFTGPALPSWG